MRIKKRPGKPGPNQWIKEGASLKCPKNAAGALGKQENIATLIDAKIIPTMVTQQAAPKKRAYADRHTPASHFHDSRREVGLK